MFLSYNSDVLIDDENSLIDTRLIQFGSDNLFNGEDHSVAAFDSDGGSFKDKSHQKRLDKQLMQV